MKKVKTNFKKIFLTFFLILLPWIFFKTRDVQEAFYVIGKIFKSYFITDINMLYPKRILMVVVFVFVEWVQRFKEHPLQIDNLPKYIRIFIYYLIVVLIILFGTYDYQPFIYFQF